MQSYPSFSQLYRKYLCTCQFFKLNIGTCCSRVFNLTRVSSLAELRFVHLNLPTYLTTEFELQTRTETIKKSIDLIFYVDFNFPCTFHLSITHYFFHLWFMINVFGKCDAICQLSLAYTCKVTSNADSTTDLFQEVLRNCWNSIL